MAQQALTKTFWYPIVKQVGKAVGIKVTKNTVAKGVTKAVPVIGGVISGTLNFASMMPMAKRLLETRDQASFQYTERKLSPITRRSNAWPMATKGIPAKSRPRLPL